MKYPFKLYIPYACNIDALNKSIDTALSQVEEYSSFEGKKICVLNDTPESIAHLINNIDKVEIFEFPYRIKMTHAQQGNWMIQDAIHTGQAFCMTIHADAEMLPGAMEDLLKKVKEVSNSKWGIVFGGATWQVFACYNLKFFQEEDVWFDPFLFPFYYMDNHMHRIMDLRGWKIHASDSPIATIIHKSSHYLKEDTIFCRKNNIAFPAHGAIYEQIWGGLPGKERVRDPYANGTLPRKTV